MSAWIETTNKKYAKGWKLWTAWCDRYPESLQCRADPFYVSLFFNDLVLNDLVLSDSKKGRIETAYLGIRWGHIIAGTESPTTHPFVKTTFEGAQRLASRGPSKNRKGPLETDMLTTLFETYGHAGNVLHLRFLVVCFLGFAWFLRIGKLLQIHL